MGLSHQQIEHEPVEYLHSNCAVASMIVAIRSGEAIFPSLCLALVRPDLESMSFLHT